MPFYNPTPFAAPPILAVAGFPVYCFGGYDDKRSPTKVLINTVTADGFAAILDGTIIDGNIPKSGSLLSTQGLLHLVPLVDAQITLVQVLNATLGTVQISAATGQSQDSQPDSGIAIITTPETTDALANGSSIPFTFGYTDTAGFAQSARVLKAVVSFGTLPTAAVVVLQTALVNQDSEYATLGTVATVASSTLTGGQAEFVAEAGRFFRFNISGLSGTGTITAKAVAS